MWCATEFLYVYPYIMIIDQLIGFNHIIPQSAIEIATTALKHLMNECIDN